MKARRDADTFYVWHHVCLLGYNNNKQTKNSCGISSSKYITIQHEQKKKQYSRNICNAAEKTKTKYNISGARFFIIKFNMKNWMFNNNICTVRLPSYIINFPFYNA